MTRGAPAYRKCSSARRRVMAWRVTANCFARRSGLPPSAWARRTQSSGISTLAANRSASRSMEGNAVSPLAWRQASGPWSAARQCRT